MDQEEIDALELTKEDLLNKIKTGQRANLPRKRPRDLNNQAFSVAAQATERSDLTSGLGVRIADMTLVRISDLRLNPKPEHSVS